MWIEILNITSLCKNTAGIYSLLSHQNFVSSSCTHSLQSRCSQSIPSLQRTWFWDLHVGAQQVFFFIEAVLMQGILKCHLCSMLSLIDLAYPSSARTTIIECTCPSQMHSHRLMLNEWCRWWRWRDAHGRRSNRCNSWCIWHNYIGAIICDVEFSECVRVVRARASASNWRLLGLVHAHQIYTYAQNNRQLNSTDHQLNSTDHQLNSTDHQLNSTDHQLNWKEAWFLCRRNQHHHHSHRSSQVFQHWWSASCDFLNLSCIVSRYSTHSILYFSHFHPFPSLLRCHFRFLSPFVRWFFQGFR